MYLVLSAQTLPTLKCFTSLGLVWHFKLLGLPQVSLNSHSVYTDGHGFGWDQVKLFNLSCIYSLSIIVLVMFFGPMQVKL